MSTTPPGTTPPASTEAKPPTNGKTRTITGPVRRRVVLREIFDQQRPELLKLLPKGMEPERFFRMALTECLKNPELLKCTAESWVLAIQTCAQQGLLPDSGLGYMYLIPRSMKKKTDRGTFWVDEVQAQRGYQGDIQLARNSGEIADIYAEVVHAKDKYVVTKGLARNIVHEPTEEDDPGPLRACYAVAKLTSGETPFVTLSRRDVERHKKASPNADKSWSPWNEHEEEMWKKTAIHVLYKMLPKSTEKAERIAGLIAGAAPIDTTAVALATVPTEPATGLEGLTARLEEEGPDEGPPEPGTCTHPSFTPERLAGLGPGEKGICVDCGELVTNPHAEEKPPSTTPAARGRQAEPPQPPTRTGRGPSQGRLTEE